MTSGRIGYLSDEEKKKRGTFDSRWSDEAKTARAAEKILAGPWLPKIPDPSLPLNEAGKAKYLEVAQLLFDQNKLTAITAERCQIYASYYMQVEAKMAAGKSPSSDALKRMDAILKELRVAENAPTIASPGQKKRFEGVGLRNSRTPPIRLRTHSAG